MHRTSFTSRSSRASHPPGTIPPPCASTPPAQTPRTGSICLARPRIRYRVQISAPRARARCAETPRASRPTPVRLKSVQRRARSDYAAPIDRARRPRARIDERCVQTSTSNTPRSSPSLPRASARPSGRRVRWVWGWTRRPDCVAGEDGVDSAEGETKGGRANERTSA